MLLLVLTLLDLGDLLLNKLNDLILVSQLVLQEMQLVLQGGHLLSLLVKLLLCIVCSLIEVIISCPELVSLIILYLKFLLVKVPIFLLALCQLFDFGVFFFELLLKFLNYNILILKHLVFRFEQITQVFDFNSGVFALSLELFLVWKSFISLFFRCEVGWIIFECKFLKLSLLLLVCEL